MLEIIQEICYFIHINIDFPNNNFFLYQMKGTNMRKFEGFEKGINLGGWLSQNTLTKEHMDSFIKESDIEKIASMGVDHVRLPIDYSVIETEDCEDIESGYTYIDNCYSWCKKYGLNMILDLHKAAGYIFDDSDNCKDFFLDAKLKQRFINLWIKLAKRYGKLSDSMAFEILNEVVDPSVKDIWNDIAEETIKEIRKYAKDTWILIGGTRNNSVISIKELRAPVDKKIVFNFHCYEPLIFTHQAAYWVDGMTEDFRISYPKDLGEYYKVALNTIGAFYADLTKGYDGVMCDKEFFKRYFKEAVDVAEKYDVPLYCGEYGVIDRAATDGVLNWFKDINAAFNEYGIHRAAWSYKQMDFGITDDHYKDIYDELIKFL